MIRTMILGFTVRNAVSRGMSHHGQLVEMLSTRTELTVRLFPNDFHYRSGLYKTRLRQQGWTYKVRMQLYVQLDRQCVQINFLRITSNFSLRFTVALFYIFQFSFCWRCWVQGTLFCVFISQVFKKCNAIMFF